MDELIYLKGEKLLGDDFTLDQIKAWYEDEKEGYSNLVAKNQNYKYSWHAINRIHGFRFLKNLTFNNVLGLGSARGDEFLPIIDRINDLKIIEASDSLISKQISGKKIKYISPTIEGKMPFENNSFDLITSLGFLHHIPNVTFVVGEAYRCLSTSGFFLVREPIVSMGDWRKPRKGLTKRERGIPLPIFEDIILNAGFKIVKKNYCVFPIIPRALKVIGVTAYNSIFFSKIDAVICLLLKKRIRYKSETMLQKIRPTSIYYVLKK